MKRTLVTAAAGAALVLPLSLVAATPAAAAPPGGADRPKNAGAACVHDGIAFLAGAGLVTTAASNNQTETIDYSDLVAVPDESYLSLGQVVKAHKQAPSLFPWC